MSAKRTDMHRLQEAVRLHRLGQSRRQISRQLKIGRDTLARYFAAFAKVPSWTAKLMSFPSSRVFAPLRKSTWNVSRPSSKAHPLNAGSQRSRRWQRPERDQLRYMTTFAFTKMTNPQEHRPNPNSHSDEAIAQATGDTNQVAPGCSYGRGALSLRLGAAKSLPKPIFCMGARVSGPQFSNKRRFPSRIH